MTRKTIITALAALAIAGISASLATAGSLGKHTDRLSYHNVDAIVLDNSQGHIHITAGHTNGVTVERTAQTLFTNATTSPYISGRVLHLNSRCHGTVCQVDYRLNTPAGVRLQITEKNATVAIDGKPGNLTVTNTEEGDLTLDLAKAPPHLRASTHKGSIEITVPHGAYAITATANDGNKTLTGVTVNRKASRSIQATAGSGDITINGR
jgi:Putative adhesin